MTNFHKQMSVWYRTYPLTADIFDGWWQVPHLTFDQYLEHSEKEEEKSQGKDFQKPYEQPVN